MSYQQYIEKIQKRLKELTWAGRLILLLVVILVLSTAIYFINPTKKMREMRNSQRRSDVISIVNAVYQYAADHDGSLPAGISSSPQMICRTKAASCGQMVDISEITADKNYQLAQVPIDPKEKDANSSGYEISKSANGRINVIAPNAENATISSSK